VEFFRDTLDETLLKNAEGRALDSASRSKAAAPSTFSAVATVMRDLVRGYTDVQLKARAKEVRAERDPQLRLARRYRATSERQRRNADRAHQNVLVPAVIIRWCELHMKRLQ